MHFQQVRIWPVFLGKRVSERLNPGTYCGKQWLQNVQMSQCGSRWASSIIIDRRWPGVSPAALWKILYSITPEPQRGPEAQLCQTSGCHGGWRMWAQWLCLLFWSDQFNVSGASRAVSNGVPPCFYVHRWPDSLQSGQQQTPHMNQPSRAGLLGWMQQLTGFTGFKTSNNIRPILPLLTPADISINCNIWLVLKLCCKPTAT